MVEVNAMQIMPKLNIAGARSRRQILVAGPALSAALLGACGPVVGGAAPRDATEVSGVVQPLLRSNAMELELFRQAFALFMQRYPKIRVDAIEGGPNYDEKAQALLAAGTMPSLYWTAANLGYRHWAAKGLKQNLDPLIARDKFDLKAFYERYLPYHKFDNKYMAIPKDENAHVLFYNKALFDAAGVKHPPQDWNDRTWTWPKFLEIGRSLTKSEGGKVVQFGVGNPMAGGARFAAMMFGGDWVPEEAYETGWIRKFTGTAPEVVEAYQFLSDLQHRHRVQPTPADLTEMGLNLNTAFTTGKTAMHVAGINFLATLEQAKGLPWAMAAIPVGPAKPRRTLAFVNQWSMFTGQPSLDAAWELLKFMVGPDGQRFWPIGRGTLPALRTLAPVWVDSRRERLGVSAAELQVPVQGVEVQHGSADSFCINWGELWDTLNAPVTDILAGKVTAKQGIEAVTPAAEAVIQRSLPAGRR
jgi:multiple sugar transport system substrate-binding protein